MKYKSEYFFCSPKLLAHIPEVNEIFECIKQVKWKEDYTQTLYNKDFEEQFISLGWKKQPLLYDNPKLIGDFQKSDVFIEIQFGNSSTIYRDYYKFHYGLSHGLLSLAVLVVPTKPAKFFPTRVKSVQNMAEYDFALKYFKLLPIPVPILLIGLIPEN